MSAPTVSIVMAAYNGAALLPATLASLQRQTFGDFEIVVVDDCSTDDTRAVLAGWDDPRLRVIHAETNGGPVRARNRAFAAARGRYIAGLDQDDLCAPERFARQVAYLDAHPEVALLGTAAQVLEDGVLKRAPHVAATSPALVRWLLHIENPLVWSSVMLRADVARRLEPFTRPDILYAEDFDLYHRIGALGQVARLDQELLIYRRHAGGASQRYETAMLDSAARVLEGAYRPVLGDLSPRIAGLIVRHVMHGLPVPDRSTLSELGTAIIALQDAYLTLEACEAADVRLIRWETARRWAGMARGALRAGTISLADALAVRPDHLGLGHAGFEELMWSRLIGTARGAIRRGRQTFAA